MRYFERQHFFTRLSTCLFLGISLFFACRSSPDPSTLKSEKGDIDTQSRIEPVARPLTPEETFEQLKRENPDNIVGGGLPNPFRTLRQLVTSKTYLDFLRRNHPLEDQYQTYDVFWEIAASHPSQYMPFLKQALENPDEEDAATAHLFAVHYRHVLTREYHGEHPDTFQDELKKLIDGPGMNIAFKHFVDAERNVLNGLDLIFFLAELTLHVGETERTDAALAAELFDKHGEHDALMWLALEDPVLIGYILKDFTDVEVFQRWMDGKFH